MQKGKRPLGVSNSFHWHTLGPLSLYLAAVAEVLPGGGGRAKCPS
jgi:hypothetical protein